MKNITVTADNLKRYDQFDVEDGTIIITSVKKSWEVIVFGDLCKAGEIPKRVELHFSPREEIKICR